MKSGKLGVKDLINKKEVSLRDLYYFIKTKLRTIVLIAVVFTILGSIKGITSRDEYETRAQFLSENVYASPFSGIGSLFGNQIHQSGISNQNSIVPDLYPTIISSDNFLRSLLHEEFYFETEQKNINLINYLTDYHHEDLLTKIIEFPKRIISGIFKKKENFSTPDITPYFSNTEEDSLDTLKRTTVLFLSPKERAALSRLRDRVTMTRSTQFFEIIVRMPDPLVSAQLNQVLIDRFIAYIKKYQTEKENENYEFILEQKINAELNYKRAQQVFSSFKDKNRGLISQSSKSQELQLQNDYNIAFNLYNQLAQQLDHAQIKLHEAKPILTMFQPPVVPHNKTEPNLVRLIIIFTIVGVFLGFAVIFLQVFIAYFKKWIHGE